MNIPPQEPFTDDPDDAPMAALIAYERAGWDIGPGWLATKKTGSQTRVIAANSAAELLERLMAAEEGPPTA